MGTPLADPPTKGSHLIIWALVMILVAFFGGMGLVGAACINSSDCWRTLTGQSTLAPTTTSTVTPTETPDPNNSVSAMETPTDTPAYVTLMLRSEPDTPTQESTAVPTNNQSPTPIPTNSPTHTPWPMPSATTRSTQVPDPRRYLSEVDMPPTSTYSLSVDEGTIHVWTAGPICISGICLTGGYRRGSIVIFLPSATPYQLTGLNPRYNWHGAFYAIEEQWDEIASGLVTSMRTPGSGCGELACNTVDVLLVGPNGVVSQETR